MTIVLKTLKNDIVGNFATMAMKDEKAKREKQEKPNDIKIKSPPEYQ